MMSKGWSVAWRQWLARAFVLVAVAALSVSVSAQTYQGGLRGLIRDPQGVVPGAEVTLSSDDAGTVRTAVSSDVGEYVFTSVLPGVYTVKVSLPGFRTEERKGLRIGTQQSIVQDFTLEIGQLAEQITVTGEAPLVERTSATVASSLDKAALQNLPIFGRNAFYAAISTPGVIQSGDPQFVRYQDQTNASYLSLGGGPRRGNGYLIAADDAPQRRRAVRSRSVSRQRHPRQPHQSGRAIDAGDPPDAGLRQVVQRRRVPARWSTASTDDQARSALERQVDHDRHVRPSEDT